ncbi:MAG: hypothetical protein M1836_004956 [Candelina mexicana]|nr:MAG: hypothetical protein M1836_004956 [Candelina mexicana]
MENKEPTLEELISAVKDQHLCRKVVEKDGKFVKYTLVFVDDTMKELVSAPLNLSFVFLGSGFNKTIFGVNAGTRTTQWALAVEKGTSSNQVHTVKAENTILTRLGSTYLRVPGPFKRIDVPKELISTVNVIFDEDKTFIKCSAYFMQRLTIGSEGRFVEMEKSERENFIRKCLEEIPDAKARIQHTIDTIKKIKEVYNEEPWADFQVLYDKADGGLLVFDPSASQIGIRMKDVNQMLDKWLKDLDEERGLSS